MESFRKLLGTAAVGLALTGVTAVDAAAQMAWAERAFVNANIGQQWADKRLVNGASFGIYEETANWESVLDVDDSLMFDVSGGYRVWKNLAIGVGYSRTTDSHDAAVSASVPDVLAFDAPHVSSREVAGLEREESAIHLSAVWMVPVTDKIDIALLAGPSWFSVKQAYVSEMTVTPGASTIGALSTATLSESAAGYHVAVDGTFRILRNVGIGGMLRYGTAKVDATAFERDTIEVGGFQALAGVRLRF